MISEQRLISQIKDFVNGLEQEPSTNEHDLAEQFAELCRSFNARMSKCEDLLEKGLRSEAVQEALAAPSLFQLRELLETPEIRKWRNICLDFSMTAPPELNFETIDRLREECSKEQLLQPLLRKFRRLVHEGTPEERMQVLRQLRVHDPENPVWVENLEPLERRQLQNIEEQANAALSTDDVETLREIYEDLTDPRRLISPPAELMEKIDSRLRQQREAEAVAEGQQLTAKLKEALAEKDFDRLGSLISQWRRLERFADFHPSDEMSNAANQAIEWYSKESQRRETDQRFRAALEKLQTSLNRPDVDRQALEQAWDHVQSFDRPVAAALQDSVPERIAELRAEEQRQQRIRRVFATTATLAAAAVLGIAGWFGWRTLQIKRHSERLQTLWANEQNSDVKEYLERLQSNNPALYKTPRIQQYKTKLTKYQEAEAERKAELEAVMEQLEKLKSAGYAMSSSRIRNILRQAEELAANPDEKRRITAWEQDWQIYKERRQAQRNNQFKELKAELQKILADLNTKGETMPSSAVEKHLERGAELVARGQDLARRVPENTRQGWQPLVIELNNWRTQLAKRQERLEEKKRERRTFLTSLPDTLQSLDHYKETVTTFLDKYPDITEAEDFQRAVRHMPACRDALDLNKVTLPAVPISAQNTRPFVKARATLGAGNASVWFQDLTTCIEYAETADEIRRDLQRLRSLRFWDWKVLRYRKKGEEKWRAFYTPDTFFSRTETAADGTRYKLYWGQAFRTSADTYEPQLERKRLNDREYDIEWKERPQDNLIPAARYGRRMLASIPGERYLEDFLLEQIKELFENPNVAAAPKAELIFRLTEFAARTIPFKHTGIEEIRDRFQKTKLDIPWINNAHPRIQEEIGNIEELLNLITDKRIGTIQRTVVFDRWLLSATLNRDVQLGGVITKDPDTGRVYPAIKKMQAESLWCMLPGGEGTPNRFYLLVYKTDNGEFTMMPNARDRAFPGQILLTPKDNDSTSQFLKTGPPMPDESKIDWPGSWPLNNP